MRNERHCYCMEENQFGAFQKLEGLPMTVVPTIKEIQGVCECPDRTIKGIVSTMASLWD